VGKVEKVTLNSGTGAAAPEVIVSAAISDRNVQIRQGDKFTVATAGVLGEAFIDILPGPASAPVAVPGAILPGEPLPGLQRSSDALLKNTGIYAGLLSLPSEKREELIKAFNEMIAKALEEEHKKSPNPSEPSAQKH
jgi:ABC-type transporter Mla subunit MlaD